MAYRRSYRRRARGPRPRYDWVRAFEYTNVQLDADTNWVVDLLQPIRAHTDMLKVNIPGPYSNQGWPKDPTVVRVRGTYTIHWQNDLGPTGWDDLMCFGVGIRNWSNTDTAFTIAVQDPTVGPLTGYDPVQEANANDWMAWETVGYEDAYTQTLTTIHAAVVRFRFDVKSKRALKDPADSLVFCSRYLGSGAGPMHQNVTTSTLLQNR